jgi:subtilisin family serine protease
MDEFKPDVTAPGVNIMSAQFNTASGYVPTYPGCSMATAIVSGLIALMLQKNRALSPSQVKHILHNTAEQKGEVYDPSVDPKYDREYGWGEVDAFLATETVKSAAVGGTIMTTSKETLAVDFGAVACCVAITVITLVIVKVRRRKRIEVP